jgi:hypothetical protein
LKFLLDQILATIPQHQWVSKPLRSDFHVEFKTGATNIVVDALSRRDTEATMEVATLFALSFKFFDVLCHELESDPTS